MQKGNRNRINLWLVLTLVAGLLMAVPATASAVTATPGAVFDDFEDGDVGDWGYFGGNMAGGGYGAADDRPAEGSWYLSTGWGGEGTASVFYGGMYKNLDNAAQVPALDDPWLNVWVLNQSNATVDGYTLEITVREDLDGNGWTDGAEDSVRLDTTFTAAAFDDRWTLISAPLSSFTNLGTGGDGAFNGAVDEVVIVISGVSGGSGSTVEVDFDRFVFTSGGPVPFDDMEHGNPNGNGWFSFGGSVGGGGIDPNTTDLPPVLGGAHSLQTGWGSGGVSGFFGGFGRTFRMDLSGTDHFNFWINPDAGQEYTLEINLQDDDDGDDAIPGGSVADDEFQFNCVVSAAGPCAVSGGGWQFVSIPFADFFDDNSFLTGGNGVLDPVPTLRGGNGRLINVVVAVIGTSGSDATFRTDYWAFSRGPLTIDVGGPTVIDDFESGLPFGTDANGTLIGFFTFQGSGSSVAISTETTPPAPILPEVGTPNSVLVMDIDSTSFAGFLHGFQNAAVDTWESQDWSTREGISMWFHGNGSGAGMFIDILDNRNPGSTRDDAERWTVAFTDDTAGWKLLEFPFSSFARKDIGNGAPNDGLGLVEMWGWALGALDTKGPQTFYVDDVKVYGEAEPPALAAQFATGSTYIEEGTVGSVEVKLTRPIGADDPDQVSISYRTEPAAATPGVEYTPTSGVLTFTRGGPSVLSFPIETFDDTKFEGDERIVLRLSDPVDMELGFLSQASAFIEDNDPYDPDIVDDFEKGAYLWDGDGLVAIDTVPTDRPGSDEVEHALAVDAAAAGDAFDAAAAGIVTSLGSLPPSDNAKKAKQVAKAIEKAIERIEDGLDPDYWINGFLLDEKDGKKAFDRFRQAAHELEKAAKYDDSIPIGDAIDGLVAIAEGLAMQAIDVAGFNGGDDKKIAKALKDVAKAESYMERGKADKAVEHYRKAWYDAMKSVNKIDDMGLGSAVHDFALGEDWSGIESVSFWYKGTGSGEDVTIVLKDNRAPDPGPDGWEMAWADEFNEPAGTPPNPENWSYEIGDVTPDGKNGWGNDERQYYTDDPANAATDGDGNLVITMREADPSLQCYYGPCEYTSARLISWNKAEFAYGRIESRLRVPDGGDGLWPAFWSLGTDIDRNPWPFAGEIDFMEFVGRLPNEIFGTIHGPGYEGGNSFGNVYDFGTPVYDDYHTFTVDWQPNLITWYVDGIRYHQATPDDVKGNPWVFDKPFFLLLNLAIGGNFGGPIDPDIVFPQEYAVDYVRVYSAPDTAERFEATFTDDSSDWQLVTVPLSAFSRSADQPDGAPNDGLTLTDVWGYGLDVPYPAAGRHMLDMVRTVPFPPPPEVTVTNLNDSGDGSLRAALGAVATGGTVHFDPALAGGTIALDSGPLVIGRDVTVDGSSAPGVVLDGGGADRVLIVDGGVTASVSHLEVRNGYGYQLAGGILNNGHLMLDHVVVADNVMGTDAGDFWQGGGGIYTGEGGSLHLVDSTVANNVSGWAGGGIYSYFGTMTTVERSTISGNTAGDVGGAMRMLGNASVVNSTLSGNGSTGGLAGGAVFQTDGAMTMTNSTVAGNTSAPGSGALFVGTFTDASAAMTLVNTVVSGEGCFAGYFGGGAVTLTADAHNVFTNGTCAPGATDTVVADALLGALADNGGPTMTHALTAGSPAIDFADPAACRATDQRGVSRPQGAGCDAGSFELEP